MQHEKYPEESQDDHQVEKLVWNHGVPPSHGVIQGAFYPVFGGRELAADWRYTTLQPMGMEYSRDDIHLGRVIVHHGNDERGEERCGLHAPDFLVLAVPHRTP
jgi:hypothetical protein